MPKLHAASDARSLPVIVPVMRTLSSDDNRSTRVPTGNASCTPWKLKAACPSVSAADRIVSLKIGPASAFSFAGFLPAVPCRPPLGFFCGVSLDPFLCRPRIRAASVQSVACHRRVCAMYV